MKKISNKIESHKRKYWYTNMTYTYTNFFFFNGWVWYMPLILAWEVEAGGSLWVQDQLQLHTEIPSRKREDIFKSLHSSKYYMQNQKKMENWEEISYEACETKKRIYRVCESSKPGKWLISKE